MAAVAGADIVAVILNFYKSALGLKIPDDCFSGLESVHTGVGGIIVCDMSVICHHIDNGQIVAQTDLKVIRVMSGSDFDNARTEIHLNIVIGDNGNFPVNYRKNNGLADNILISLILGIHRDGGIAEKCFRSRCGELKISAAVLEGIAQMPEMAGLILILNLGIRNGCQAVGAPVDDSLASVNQTLFIELAEYLADRSAAALVESETLSVPVAGGAHFLELLDNPAAVCFLPLPGSLKKSLSAEIFFCQSFRLHGLNNLCLCSY